MLLYMAGWGAVAVSAGLVGVVKECQARPEMRRLTAAFAVSLGSVLLMSLPDPWNLRFVLFFPALLGIAALRLVEGRRTLQWLLAAGIGVQVLSTMAPAEFGVGEIRDRLGVSWQRRWTRLIPHDPWSTDRIAAGPAARRTYLLYRPDFSARVVTVLDDDPDGFARRLRESGAKVVHADPTHPVIRACLQRRHLRAESGNFFSLEPR
jgi:hypothetical protein